MELNPERKPGKVLRLYRISPFCSINLKSQSHNGLKQNMFIRLNGPVKVWTLSVQVWAILWRKTAQDGRYLPTVVSQHINSTGLNINACKYYLEKIKTMYLFLFHFKIMHHFVVVCGCSITKRKKAWWVEILLLVIFNNIGIIIDILPIII